jgi:Arc/MetJ-type ribon-helix-helix transcriptional regulator
MAKVMISLPDEFLRKVDRKARSENRSRSEIIREALRPVLAPRQSRPRDWRKALAPLRALEERWIGEWDSTDIIRYYRDRRHGEDRS